MIHAPRPRSQRTIGRPVAVEGVGYWSGRGNRVVLEPAGTGAGVVFVRADLGEAIRIPATADHRVSTAGRTNLVAGVGRVEMVEHVLSALAGLAIDCCVIRVHGEELPGLDGSALAFVEAIEAAGTVELEDPIDPLVVSAPVRIGDADAWIEASAPEFAGLSVEYELDYGPGPIGRQTWRGRLDPAAYREGLAAARTFLPAADAERLRAQGRGLTATTGDLLVFGPDGPIGNALRWPDECVRHKVLDLVGDLALAGRPIHAHVRAFRTGHRHNGELAARLAAAAAGGDA